MTLDLSSLKKALLSLENILKTSSSSQSYSPNVKDAIRSGVIQNFEFTYELCWKFMKRWLENNVSVFLTEGVSRRELFRMAAENSLIDDVDVWMEYHKARNETAHTYDESKAEEVFQAAGRFFLDAQKLLRTLESKNG